jgi:hypothetical protein
LPQAQPLTIRRLAEADRTRLYVANDSPWAIEATLTFESEEAFKITQLSTGEAIGSDEDPSWQLSVPPYDVAICTLSAPDVRVADVVTEVAEELIYLLETEIDKLDRHLSRMRPWKVLKNASFEPVNGGANLAEWHLSQGVDQRVTVDTTQAAEGKRSLLMKSRTPAGRYRGPVAWFRSQDLPTPASGRLAVQAQVRFADGAQQPRLRLVVEGQADGKQFKKQAEYGGDQDLSTLNGQWQKVGMLVDDLPNGEIKNLRVGVDLQGTGQVWVDDMRLFDVWLTRSEATHVSEQLRLASVSLAEGRFQDCRHTLQRVGPQYLRHHFGHLPQPERFEGAPVEAGERIRNRAERLHQEIDRAPIAVMTARPPERPASPEIREIQQVLPQEVEPREHQGPQPDPNQEPAPRVLTDRRKQVGRPHTMPPLQPQDLGLPSRPASGPPTVTNTDTTDEEKSGISTWFDKVFYPRKRTETPPSEPATVRPQQQRSSQQPTESAIRRQEQNPLPRLFLGSRDESSE